MTVFRRSEPQTAEYSVDQILGMCESKGNLIELPDIELSPDLFRAVNKKMKENGGKYNSKAKGFVFMKNPPDFFQWRK